MRACLLHRLALLALVVASSSASVALADDPAPDHAIVLETQHIVGVRQAPSVVPVLSRARFRYRAPELERHATDAIVESVTHPPF